MSVVFYPLSISSNFECRVTSFDFLHNILIINADLKLKTRNQNVIQLTSPF